MLSQYSRLSEAYEGDDDPACASSGGGYDDTKPVRKSGKIHANAVLHYVRIMVEISILIVVLTILGIQWKHASTSSPVISTMPEFDTRSVLFRQDEVFCSVESFENREKLEETMRNWTRLSPRSRGTIYLSPSQRHGLPPPYNMSGRAKLHNLTMPSDVYMVSVFHQLHCLSHLMRTYGLLVLEGQIPSNLQHIAHCFDYVRQGILCAGDTTIEGRTQYGEGWGSSHQCRDIRAIQEWVDEHMGLPEGDFSDIL